ncbi:unnamed protein product [Calypogeia fissa]
MEGRKFTGSMALVLALLLLQATTLCLAWNTDGHAIICNLARPLITPAAMVQVNNLMNSQFQHNFSTLCTWGEEVQYLPQYSWSPPLHSVNTPDKLCNYNYTRDCVGVFGEPNFCASGAVKNYTSQLVDPNSQYNKTEALLFMSNILGDIHQPLRCGFMGDGGGSFIEVWWMNTQNGSRTDLFSVWDSLMTHEAYERYYNQSNPTYNETLVDILGNMSLSIYSNLTTADISAWSPCPAGPASCPDIYVTESVQLACQYAYAGVTSDQILTNQYFTTGLPVVEKRLLQAGVRLAATLNRIFDPTYVSPPLAPAPGIPAPTPPLPPVPAPALSPVPSAPLNASAPPPASPAATPTAPAPSVVSPATPGPVVSVPTDPVLGTPILTPLPSMG